MSPLERLAEVSGEHDSERTNWALQAAAALIGVVMALIFIAGG